MTTATEDKPAPAPKAPKTNRIGLEVDAYQGGASTLCSGCGHDSITNSIVKAFWEMGVQTHNVAKMSGIGCSSKTTAYFMKESHGFNAVHGRMAAIATGTAMANKHLVKIGVSGDGDTSNIGMGNFLHMVRRNVPLIYIIENNGCYGLTKGQFSATADKGSASKGGAVNSMPPVDLCGLVIQMGCGFVARSFSGDFKQVQALLKAAIAHNGTAVIDIVSPCITFNNHEGSTKSYGYAKAHEEPLHDIGFVPYFDETRVDYEPGTTAVVPLPDGSKITLTKLNHDYDPTDRVQAMQILQKAEVEGHFYTGLIYHDEHCATFENQLNMVDEPLATLPAERIRPSNEVFAEIMETFK